MSTVTVKGFLVDGISHIGGEGSGWEIQTESMGDIEVDVEQQMAQALRLRNKFVTIIGYYTTREYIERGSVETLVAEQIRLASDPQP